MIDRSTWIHLRFPFSFFLAPIALFGFSEAAGPLAWPNAALLFIVLHGLLYPASNGFNSYYDRDEGSIGGVARPPPVTGNLLAWSLVLDIVAVVVAVFVAPGFALVAFVFGLFSKAYSWDRVRLKRRPIFSWLGIGVVQGGLVFFAAAYFGGVSRPAPGETRLWSGAAAIALFYLAGYPLTQIYQHDEDRRRGDRTISMLCGVRGTFALCAVLFTAATAVFGFHYAVVRQAPGRAAAFVFAQAPLVLYFLAWAHRAWRDPAAADFRGAMGMNLLSAGVMNAFFVGMLCLS